MNCDSVKKILLEEELDIPQSYSVAEHIKSCKECKSFSANISKANSLLTNLKSNKPILNEPELLTNRILHQIRSEHVEKRETQTSPVDTF